ncbi:fatty acyl-AMP ligase [Echinicola jeungdonensis]|uniref:Fatty acyl-AMP ligase n=1 Tax=Echinicola jeungdonensis TaxID=709343 RepID=A0ABV5J2J2_9BACT|nr:fatty acyl-AMP ligase [Echinicola jeungdonensis]MDN3667764.1 fatty acyl-AMP ligase [Echinicola jeungdonensis]
MGKKPLTLVEILRWRSNLQPHNLAYRFLKDGECDEETISYKELDRQARSIGALLQETINEGERAIILHSSGLDFIISFLGCLYAKIIAVPVSPPHPARLETTLETTLRIIENAKPKVALLSNSLFRSIQIGSGLKEKFKSLKLLATEGIDTEELSKNWEQSDYNGEELAFLQYTSGSTFFPKGVMVSHNNLMHNQEIIQECFGHTHESRGVIWLPPYHDMGLIGGFLQPLFTGFTVTIIPNLMILQKPIRWLQAITRYKATSSGGPNFAYDVCLKKVKPEDRDQLDLSTWEVAFNGAEPIRKNTLDKFTEFFAPCGFRKEAFLPCYGLAEATLMVTGGAKNRRFVSQKLLKSGLEKNKVVFSKGSEEDIAQIVGCGKKFDSIKIKIVNPENLNSCDPNEIGEVWVAGQSIAKGYWNNPLESSVTFGGYLSETGEGPFLRTGDLGFVFEDELYITGRLKDIIIIDGKNHYAHDIERTVISAHPSIRPAGCAVFSIENSEKDQVVVIAEIQYWLIQNIEEVKKSIRQAVAEQHNVSIYDIKLTLPGSIPRTTSGKIRHYLCKEDYLSGVLKEITMP